MQIYIGLDFGKERIGVARINTIAKIAEPLDMVKNDDNGVIEKIALLVSEMQADGIVVGLPRGLNSGQETEQTEFSRKFALEIKNKIKTEVYMIDEAGSSKAADDRIGKKTNLSRDSVAAAIILEDFINFNDKSSLRI